MSVVGDGNEHEFELQPEGQLRIIRWKKYAENMIQHFQVHDR